MACCWYGDEPGAGYGAYWACGDGNPCWCWGTNGAGMRGANDCELLESCDGPCEDGFGGSELIEPCDERESNAGRPTGGVEPAGLCDGAAPKNECRFSGALGAVGSAPNACGLPLPFTAGGFAGEDDRIAFLSFTLPNATLAAPDEGPCRQLSGLSKVCTARRASACGRAPGKKGGLTVGGAADRADARGRDLDAVDLDALLARVAGGGRWGSYAHRSGSVLGRGGDGRDRGESGAGRSDGRGDIDLAVHSGRGRLRLGRRGGVVLERGDRPDGVLAHAGRLRSGRARTRARCWRGRGAGRGAGGGLCGGGGLNAGRSAAHLRWYGLDGSTPERARGGRRRNGNRRRGGDDGLARGGATAVCTGAPGQPRPLCTTSKQISPAGTLGGVALGARSKGRGRALEKETSAGRSIEGSRRSARVYSRSDDYGRQLRKLAGGRAEEVSPGDGPQV